MTKDELSKLTDQELLDLAKNSKPNKMLNAVLIGVMIGIIIYSIFKSSLGLFSLIPLFFIFKIINKSKRDKELEALLKERGLK